MEGAAVIQSHFRGEVAVCVSWPGEGRDSVVPPAAPLRDVDWSERRATCWPCGAKDDPERKKLEEEPESLPDPLHEAKVEETYLRRTRRRPSEELGTARRSLRIEKLLERMEREGMTSEKLLVPAFEDEARREELKKLEVKVESKQKETEHQMEFRKRIQERTRRMASVKTHMSYKSIVREYGEEAEEGNLMELIERIQKIFQPKHTLRPTGTRRKFESSVRSIRVHVSVAKVYEAPLRVDPRAAAAPAAPAPLPPRPGTTWGYQGGFGGTKPGTLFGAEAQSHQLPEIVIELTLQDFQGNLLFRRTDRARKSTDPDINQILELPLHAGNIPGQEELTQDSLTKYSGELTINIFDELTQSIPSGREVRIRRQLRHLGRFVLPWSTLYSAKCSLKGNFLVDEHPVLFGYRPKVQKKPMVTTETGLPAPPPEKETPKPMCLALDVTVDPPLEHPTRVQPQITLGKEANMMLKHIQKWHDSLKSKHDTRILALGMDVDGRSRLICRYIRPQKPPEHISAEDPFAIEMAAKYVALVPSLQDNEMWNVDDLWCTDQEFLEIQCGDWEEHCILLCNYFNYIDRFRRERVAGYNFTDIQSYCVICDLVPEGEAVVVLRQDKTTGNCEFWHAIQGKCFFLPASMQL
ncbi:Coiled-coil and C2 domain-containing protein 2A, partial [Durusdinium trenchii]